ncbi:MAG TPA: hypothetical protein VJ739_07770, partial [Gemmataceae bacterium]|nr:hypothetical protein [Gemmataceae bacterium]
AAPTKMYTNKQQFRLPFNLDERERQKLREIQLYVKYGDEGWACRETAQPSQRAFTFHAAQDGEYSFNIVTVDKAGRPTPADVTHEAPALVVVVDTAAPDLQVIPVPAAVSPSGEDCLRCVVRDANPDPSTVKLEYQAADKSWKALEPVPGSPDLFRCPGKASWSGRLRASATDRADNHATREVALEGPAAPHVTASAAPAHVETRSEKVAVPAPKPMPVTAGPDLNPPIVRTSVKMPAEPAPRHEPPAVAHHEPMPPVHTEPAPAHRCACPAEREQGMANRQLLNSTHAVLDYRIDQVGPSGVSKVEVWMTADEGKTWQRLCEDRNHRSPVEFDLPREGLYGICIVVTNGNSISDPPPTAGTTPDWWIEVDTTRPTAQLQSVRPGSAEDAGTLLITWAASDKNLGNDPVDLYYATNQNGPWSPIGRGLRNDGAYRWTAPRDGTGQYYIRMDVTDRAGNLTRCETPQAVVLDLTHPKAKVLSVSTSPRPLATPPVGN